MTTNNTPSRPEYIHNRNYRSSIRLNHNHWWVKDVTGYLIHPTIQPNLPSDARIADVGAGTGIWLFNTSTILPPTTTLDGYDISSTQYPPSSFWPSNVKLYEHDAFQPFPSEVQGTYDFVHARFFLTLLNDQDAEGLLGNLAGLLKPGGYLQWTEPDANNATAHGSTSETSTPAINQLATMWRKPKPDSSYNWLTTLPNTFSKYSLTPLQTSKHAIPPHYRQIWNQACLFGFDDLINGFSVIGVEQQEGLRKLIDNLQEEFGKGGWIETCLICWVGRKDV